MASPETRILIGILVLPFVLGVFASLIADKKTSIRLSLSMAAVGGLITAMEAVMFWRDPLRPAVKLLQVSPAFENLMPFVPEISVDLFSAFLLLLVGLLSAGVSIFSVFSLGHTARSRRVAGVYNILVLATVLLLMVNTVFTFLVVLETMTLAFAYLTLYRHNVLVEERSASPEQLADAKRAFKVYLIFSHVGFTFVMAAFLMLGLNSDYNMSFDAFRRSPVSSIGNVYADGIFLLALAGFGIKAAIVPAHSWMGLTHPFLPTSIHALVSSVVVKVAGLYGFVRVVIEFLDVPPIWWGWLVILLAGLTAVVGVFQAITSRDLKTALANHTVENIGIILAGLGLAVLLRSSQHVSPALVALALAASLYHLLNHAIFKSLLFLGTAVIEHTAGTVSFGELGGLIHRLPWTAGTFLLGSVAIAGFPPLNGFVSEWLILQLGFVTQAYYPDAFSVPLVGIGVLFMILMLGTAFGLTALTFVKIAGKTLLGAPKGKTPGKGRPVRQSGDPWQMVWLLVVLSLACLALGILPGGVMAKLVLIGQDLLGPSPDIGVADMSVPTSLGLHVPLQNGEMYVANLAMVPLLLVGGLIVLPLAFMVMGTTRRRSRSAIWNCGSVYRPETMQISSSAFSFLVWEWASSQEQTADGLDPDRVTVNEADREHVAGPGRTQDALIPWRLPQSYSRYVMDYYRKTMNVVLRRMLRASDDFGDFFQGGDIRQYLTYLFIVFVLALVALVLLQG